MIFFRLPLQKNPSPEHGDTGEGLSEWREFQEPKFTYSSLLLLHAAHLHTARYSERCGYCRYD